MKERDSNFELLRIVAMLCIVLYHFCSYIKGNIDPDNRFVLLGYTILHFGVPVFILISGYFSIKTTIQKIVSFYLYCVIWYVICYLISIIFLNHSISWKEVLNIFFPFTHNGGRWFVTYYFWLFILAPILNSFSDKCSIKEHLLFTFTLTCLIIYWGLIWQSEIINSGKSIIYFIDIYLIGQLLRKTSLITGRIQKYIYIYFFNNCYYNWKFCYSRDSFKGI